MFYFVGALLWCVMAAQATPKLRSLSGDVEHVTVKEIQTGHVRVQRSANDDCHFPATLSFQFKIQEEKIIINLEKNEYLSRRVPLYVTSNGHTRREEVSDENKFAAYQDVTRGSAMLVSCQDDGTFRLHGSFRYGGLMYHISHSDVQEPSPVHYIQRNQQTGETGEEGRYLNDSVLPPDYVRDELQNSNKTHRGKRAEIPGGNIVELLFSIDKAFYEYFLNDQGSDGAAKIAIELYAALLANEMDLHFCSVDMVDPSLSIKIYLVGVEIPETGSDVSWSTSSQADSDGVTYLDINTILTNVRSWVAGESNLPQYDHLMALSMLDVVSFDYNPVYTGVEGIAYRGTVCSTSYKVSFTEVDGSRASGTAAHELGHGLNAIHDGESTATSCSASAKNIMTSVGSATTTSEYAEAQWTFSSCSVAAFKSFIDSLSTNCMQQHAFTGTEFEALQAKSLPGTVYSLDQQCQLYNGPWSTSCDNTISESDCYNGYHCSTSASLPGGCQTGYYPLYPLAGTPCGAAEDNKWCYRGLCVTRPDEATTSSTTSSTTSTTSTTSPTTSSTTSSTPSTTICTTSSVSTSPTTTTSTTTTSTTSASTTSPTTSTTSTTSPTTSSTSTTSPTTSSTSTTSPTTSTTSTTSPTTSTTSTTSPTTSSTSTTSPTTSTTSTTSPTTSTTSTTSPTTSTTPTTSPTTSSTSTTSPTTSSTSTTSPTTTTSAPTTSTTSAPCIKNKKCCSKINNKKMCCKGPKCCTSANSWSVDTDCYKSCCSSTGTTTLATVSPYCSQECCVKRKGKSKCCTGRACCSVSFGAKLDCCTLCNEIGTTTTVVPCFKGKCCGEIQKGKKIKKVCCKGKKCCKTSYAADSVCCTTCS